MSQDAFDVMGLVRAGERWLASGHPGEGMDAPGDLGLIESTDAGRSWQARGTVGGQPAAVAADGAVVVALVGVTLLQSTDGGRTFDPRLTGVGGH